MNIPEYISIAEVQKVCRELGVNDWTQLDNGQISEQDARIVQEAIGAEASQIPLMEFKQGLEVEIEHGITFPDANVTNNHPLVTGKIVLAHLKEMKDYYSRLEVAELEGDMLKAILRSDPTALARNYAKLLEARGRLSQMEAEMVVHKQENS